MELMKLNIQLFATGGSFNSSSVTGYGVTFYSTFSWTRTNTPTSTDNKSVIDWTLKGYVGTGNYRTIYNPKVTVNGTEYNGTAGSCSDGMTIASGTTTIKHDDDGKKSFSVSISIGVGSTTTLSTGTKSFTLDTIPRYATSNQSLKSKTETSITMNWSSDSTIDYIWYSTNNGTNWTAVGSVNAKSGSYTISGLSANTTYNIKTRVRRKDSQLTTDSDKSSIATYQYPYVSAVGTSELKIGNSQTLTLYNPLGRTVAVYMKKDNTSGTQLYSGTTTNTSITFTPTATTLYNSIPTSQSGNAVYYCTYSNQTVQTKSGTYKIKGDEYPTFTNYAYEDTNTNVINLTGSNQILVNGYSTPKVTISSSNKMTSSYGANLDKYVATWGNKSQNIAYATTDVNGTISDGGSGNTLKVTAYDKRGLSKEVSKSISNVAYTTPVITNLKTFRRNGVEAVTYLSLNIQLANINWNLNNRQNDLTYIAYQSKPKNSSTWSTVKDITNTFKAKATKTSNSSIIMYTLDFNDELDIHANGISGGYTIGTEYDLKLYIRDGYNNYYLIQPEQETNVTDGKVGMSRYKDSDGEYHYGFGCMPSGEHSMVVNDKPVLTYRVIGTF